MNERVKKERNYMMKRSSDLRISRTGIAFPLNLTATLLLSVMLSLLFGGGALYGADVDKLLTTNLDQRYLKTAPLVKITAKGKPEKEVMAMISGVDSPVGPGWKAGEEVVLNVDLKGLKVIKSVHIRFRGSASWKELGCSTDRRSWAPMEATVNSYAKNITTWYEALDYAVPTRYLRLLATAGEDGFSIDDLRIYGADSPEEVSLVDGIYPLPAPAVAGSNLKLNVVVANTGSKAMRGLEVTLTQRSPKTQTIGVREENVLAPGRSRALTFPWTPTEAEPHQITATLRWEEEGGVLKEENQSFILPVVNRKLYFVSGYRAPTFEGPTNFNMNNGFPWWDPGKTRIIHRRGGLLVGHQADAAHGGPKDVETLTKSFISGMDQSDGMCIDEYTYDDDPETIKINIEALTRARAARPDKFITAWAHTPDHYINLFRTTADLVWIESYMTLHGPKRYEEFFGSQINDLRKHGMSERAVLVQGIFGWKTPMTLEDLENSVRFVRHYAPEIPGMGFYGGFVRGPWAKHYALCDELCYKYFIAPVITSAGKLLVKEGVMMAVLKNIGGMNAHEVKIAAVEKKTKREIGRSDALSIPADGSVTVFLSLPKDAEAAELNMRIVPSENYTVLEYVSPEGLFAQHRAAEGGRGVKRVAYISRDDNGKAPVPDEAWRSKDDTPPDARNDYKSLNQNSPAGGAFHPSVVLDLGKIPDRLVTRIRCRGQGKPTGEKATAFLENTRVFVSNDNSNYKPAPAGYKVIFTGKPHARFLEVTGLKVKSRYIKLNNTYESGPAGIYSVTTIPEGKDGWGLGGDTGLVGWDVYLEKKK